MAYDENKHNDGNLCCKRIQDNLSTLWGSIPVLEDTWIGYSLTTIRANDKAKQSKST